MSRRKFLATTGTLGAGLILGGFLWRHPALVSADDASSGGPSLPSVSAVTDGYNGFVRYPSASPSDNRRVIVFFDPLCPHCMNFWEATKDTGIAQVWVPVAVLDRGAGVDIGAWLVGSKTPSDDLVQIKEALAAGRPVEVYPSADQVAKVELNTKRFLDTGIKGVPTFVIMDQNGVAKITNGGVPRETFAAWVEAAKKPAEPAASAS